jgi:hypothetical protein
MINPLLHLIIRIIREILTPPRKLIDTLWKISEGMSKFEADITFEAKLKELSIQEEQQISKLILYLVSLFPNGEIQGCIKLFEEQHEKPFSEKDVSEIKSLMNTFVKIGSKINSYVDHLLDDRQKEFCKIFRRLSGLSAEELISIQQLVGIEYKEACGEVKKNIKSALQAVEDGNTGMIRCLTDIFGGLVPAFPRLQQALENCEKYFFEMKQALEKPKANRENWIKTTDKSLTRFATGLTRVHDAIFLQPVFVSLTLLCKRIEDSNGNERGLILVGTLIVRIYG